jgi:hypothetical protein
MVTLQSEFQKLIASLQDIAKRIPINKEEMKVLEGECMAASKQIAEAGFADTCPHEIWHYLSDVDVHFKDPEYMKRQHPLFVSAINAWLLSQEASNE